MINRPRHLTILFISVLLLAGGVYQYFTNQSNQTEQRVEPFGQPKENSEQLVGYSAQVAYVVDGDTVKVSVDGEQETVRLIGVDAPEVAHEPDATTECYGQEATDRAIEFLGGQEVLVTGDPTQAKVDDYGRTLAYLTLPDGRDLGELMIVTGHAEEFTFSDVYQKQSSYQAAETSAQKRNKGLWQECK